MRYSEAYCRLPVAELYRAYRRAEGGLVWRERTGTVIGSATVLSCFNDDMQVAFNLSAFGVVEAFCGELSVAIIWRAAGLHRLEPYATCPSCARPVKQLIAKGHAWKCRTCHELVNRGSLIRSNARLTESVERLEAEVGAGRPKGMHSSTYNMRLAQLADRKARLSGNTLRADSRFEQIVRHEIHGKPKKIKRCRARSTEARFLMLFSDNILKYLNEQFVTRSSSVMHVISKLREIDKVEFGIGLIVSATKLEPITLGELAEFDDRSSLGGAQTIVEVPFGGESGLLLYKSAVGSSLPPCFGEIDEPARLIRFVFGGSLEDNPALRVQIDEQLSVLRQQVQRQTLVVAEYNSRLPAEAERYIAFHEGQKAGRRR